MPLNDSIGSLLGVSTTGTATSSSDSSSLIKTSNNTIFQMAALVSKVRALSQQANSLKDSNATGVAALRQQVNAALAQFNSISDAVASANGTSAAVAGATVITAAVGGSTGNNAAKTASTSVSANTANASLLDLQKMLTEMQTNLHDNINKVGAAVQKAIVASAPTAFSQTQPGSAANQWAALWQQLYRSGKTYL